MTLNYTFAVGWGSSLGFIECVMVELDFIGGRVLFRVVVAGEGGGGTVGRPYILVSLC